jgi:hypothetical protein
MLGAKQGKQYGEENMDNQEKLNLINDFNWLRKKFGENNE